jgi:hypothetical protein
MAFAVVHKKNTGALRELGLYYLKNFGANYCGDLSVMMCCLVNGGFHPAQVQQALHGARRNPCLKQLLQDGRTRIVDMELSNQSADVLDWSHADSVVEADSNNIPTLKTWGDEIRDGQRLDFRGIQLLSQVYNISTQITQQMVDGEKYELRDADGSSTPLAENGLILWTGACHFEAMVTKVIS